MLQIEVSYFLFDYAKIKGGNNEGRCLAGQNISVVRSRANTKTASYHLTVALAPTQIPRTNGTA